MVRTDLVESLELTTDELAHSRYLSFYAYGVGRVVRPYDQVEDLRCRFTEYGGC